MKNIQSNIIGLPLKTQLFGGFRKTDVTQYIKDMAEQVEAERAELKKEKAQVYELMEKSQAFCEKLTLEAQQKADALLLDAQKKADELLLEAGKEVKQVQEDRQLMLAQSQAEAKKLVSIITRQRQAAADSYEEMLRPAAKLLSALGGEADAT